MGDADSLPPSKKRVAGREISRDDLDLDADDDDTEQEMGTFKRASDEVLATRKIVKVRRNQPSSVTSSNPFARVCLLPVPGDSASESSDLPATTKPANEETLPKVSGDDTANPEETDENKGGDDTFKPEETDKNKSVPEPSSDLVSTHEEVKQDNEEALGNTTKEPKGPDGTGDELKTGTIISAEEACDETKVDSGAEVIGPNPTNRVDEAVSQELKVKEGETSGGRETSGSPTPLNSFRQLSSSRNAFTGLAGTGFSNSSFSFGTLPKEGSSSFGTAGFGSGSASIFGLKGSGASLPLFGTGSPNNGSSSLKGFGSLAGDSNNSGGTSLPTMQEVPVETGEENEKAVFVTDASLFEFLDGGWKERGKGELKLNVPREGAGKPRLVMRTRGNYRLILNASLYPDMKLTNMDKKGITFACINSASEGKNNLATFALKFKEISTVDAFRAAVMDQKGNKTAVLKTPENSPKGSYD